MNCGRFKGSSTEPLHLQVTLPFSSLTHHTAQNSLTSATDSLSSHGFAHTSVQHFIKGCSPICHSLKSCQVPKGRAKLLHVVGAISQNAPGVRRLKAIALQKGRENMKGRIIPSWTAKPNFEKQVLQRLTQIHMMFSRTVFSREGEVCAWLSGQRLLRLLQPAHLTPQQTCT